MNSHLDTLDTYSEKENKQWLRRVLVQYSNMVNKSIKLESGHSNQTRFNANDVNKAYKLIYEKTSSNPYSESMFRIKDLFREDKETVDYLTTIKTRPIVGGAFTYLDIKDIKFRLAKSIFLYICRINFVSGTKIKYVLEEQVDDLAKIISSLEEALTNQTPKGIYDKIESFISDINELKKSLNTRYKIHNNEGDHISFKDLCMATIRRDPKSFHLLVKNGTLVSVPPSRASMISARTWYMEKGFDQYKDIPSDPVTENLLYALMWG